MKARFPTPLFILGFFVFLYGCSSMDKDTLATIDGKAISVESFTAKNPIARFAGKDHPFIDSKVDVFVKEALFTQAAMERGLGDDTEIQEKKLAAEKRQMLQHVYTREILDAVISEEYLRELYDQSGTELNARHILLQFEGTSRSSSSRSKTDALALMGQINNRLSNGESFADLAKEFTDDPTGKDNGGDLGWFGWGKMVGPFQDAAFKLNPGEVSNVVETSFGYHIIKVEDIKEARRRGVKFMTFDNEPELYKIAKYCPGADVLVRIKVVNLGSIVELSLKFGADSDQAVHLLQKAKKLGLRPRGVSFHVGSQCTKAESYLNALEVCSAIFDEAREECRGDWLVQVQADTVFHPVTVLAARRFLEKGNNAAKFDSVKALRHQYRWNWQDHYRTDYLNLIFRKAAGKVYHDAIDVFVEGRLSQALCPLFRRYPVADSAWVFFENLLGKITGCLEIWESSELEENLKNQDFRWYNKATGRSFKDDLAAYREKGLLPAAFQAGGSPYADILPRNLLPLVGKKRYEVAPRFKDPDGIYRPGPEELQAMAEQLGAVKARPRDAIDIYVRALQALSRNATPQKAQAYAEEGRLLVLKLMGNLVSFYRKYFTGSSYQ